MARYDPLEVEIKIPESVYAALQQSNPLLQVTTTDTAGQETVFRDLTNNVWWRGGGDFCKKFIEKF